MRGYDTSGNDKSIAFSSLTTSKVTNIKFDFFPFKTPSVIAETQSSTQSKSDLTYSLLVSKAYRAKFLSLFRVFFLSMAKHLQKVSVTRSRGGAEKAKGEAQKKKATQITCSTGQQLLRTPRPVSSQFYCTYNYHPCLDACISRTYHSEFGINCK